MMIEKSIEANVISAVESLGLPGLAVRGAWQAAEDGDVKDVEGSSPAALAVAISPRKFETFGFSTCSMEVALALVVRTDLCPSGTALETYADPIASLLQAWNLTLDCDHDCGLGTDGFVPGGLQMAGGTSPEVNRDAATWSITFNFTLQGTVSPSTSTSNEQQGNS